MTPNQESDTVPNMIFLAGTKNTMLWVAVIPHQTLSRDDDALLRELMTASGIRGIELLHLDPREGLSNTVEMFPEARDMAVLEDSQPLVWKCPTCGRTAPRWDETTPPECCSGETRKDVVLRGLPWEN